MNKTQIDYAFARIDGLLKEQRAEIQRKYVKDAKTLSGEERAALIRSGAVKLKPALVRIDSYAQVCDAFDFSSHAWPKSFDEKAVEREMRPLVKEARILKDRIMLGDESTALAALELFSGKCGGDE